MSFVRIASIVPDIATRAIDHAFDYLVPERLERSCTVGATVLVTFSHRDVVGYVIDLKDEPSQGLAPERVLPVRRVLAESAFDEHSARVAQWISHEYACTLPDAIRPFLAPGQTMRVRRKKEGDPWQLVVERSGPVDERWVTLTPAARDFEPRPHASRQRLVLAALRDGELRMAELSATLPGSAGTVSTLAKRGVVRVEARRRVRGGDVTRSEMPGTRRGRARGWCHRLGKD